MATAEKDGEALSRDVRAFAAQLGIAGAGAHDFDDFGAQVAAKRAAGPAHGGRPGKRKRGPAGRADGQEGAPGVRRQARGQDVAKRVKKYQKPGVGPSEESKNFRSLLGPDEPPIWYEAAANLPDLEQPEDGAAQHSSDAEVSSKHQAAEEAMKREVAAFRARLLKENYKDATWLEQVRRTGTTGDKIAALTISIRESAVANLEELDPLLLLMEKRKGTREMVARSMEALSELFRICLLPDRKLKCFKDQPVHLVSADSNGSRRLLYWCLEDGLKLRYARFVAALESASMDRLEFLRDHATRNVLQLLSEKPEQEGRLLSALVNKLGDPKKKLASRVTYYIDKLLTQHPMMKEVVIREIERFAFKSGLSTRATFYAVTCLSQMQLDRRLEKDKKLAIKLLGIYMSLFKMLMTGSIGHKADERRKAKLKIENGGRRARNSKWRKEQNAQRFEEVDARLLSHIISGVSRAVGLVPGAAANKVVDEHLEDLLRVVHVAPFGVGAQTLKLLFKVLPGRSTSGDRLYRALYSRVVSSELPSSTKLPVFMSLLFTAMKDDPSLARTGAFAKRLLQTAGTCEPHVACGCLILLSEVIKIKPGLRSAVLQPEEDDDAGMEEFKDVEDKRETAIQECATDGDKSEVTSDSSGLSSRDAEDQEADQESSSGDEWNEEGQDLAKLPGRAPPASTALANGHGKHKKGANLRTTAASGIEKKNGYDIAKREPLFCGAEKCCWWELCVLASHGHPTVAKMARSMMSGGVAKYDGDPLQGLNLTAFLDKFLGNEAKAHAEGTVFRPMGGVQAGAGLARVGSSAFSNLAERNVPEADVFFHKYYNAQSVRSRREKKRSVRRLKKGRKKDEQGEEGGMEEYIDDDDLFLADDAEDGSEEGDGEVEVNVDDLFSEDKYDKKGKKRKGKEKEKGPVARTDDGDEPSDYSYDGLGAAMEDEDVAGDSDLSVSDMDGFGDVDGSLASSSDEGGEDAGDGDEGAAPDGLMAAEFPELGSSSDEGELEEQPPTSKRHGTAKKTKRGAGKKRKGTTGNVFAPAEEYEALTSWRR